MNGNCNHGGDDCLLWGMGWAARTVDAWRKAFGDTVAKQMILDQTFLRGLGCQEHVNAILTAWGQ